MISSTDAKKCLWQNVTFFHNFKNTQKNRNWWMLPLHDNMGVGAGVDVSVYTLDLNPASYLMGNIKTFLQRSGTG